MGCCASVEQEKKVGSSATTKNNNNNNNNNNTKNIPDAGNFTNNNPPPTPSNNTNNNNNNNNIIDDKNNINKQNVTATAPKDSKNSSSSTLKATSEQQSSVNQGSSIKYEDSSHTNNNKQEQHSETTIAAVDAAKTQSRTGTNVPSTGTTSSSSPLTTPQQHPNTSGNIAKPTTTHDAAPVQQPQTQQQPQQQKPKSSPPASSGLFPLVQDNWKDIMVNHDEEKADEHNFGLIFYSHFFNDHPELPQTLFRDVEATAQRSALVKVLNAAIGLLPSSGSQMPPALTETLRVLGARHVNYGTEPFHYGMVRENLIKALRTVLGPKLTPAAEAEWYTLYDYIAKTMIDAADSEQGDVYRARLHKKRAGEFKSILERTFHGTKTRLPEFSRLVLSYVINGADSITVSYNTLISSGTASNSNIGAGGSGTQAVVAGPGSDNNSNSSNNEDEGRGQASPAAPRIVVNGREIIFIDRDCELVSRLSDCFSIAIADCTNKESAEPIRELAADFISYANSSNSFYQFSQNDKDTFPEALVAVLEMKKRQELSLYELMILEWFFKPFLAGIGGQKVEGKRNQRSPTMTPPLASSPTTSVPAEGHNNNNNNENSPFSLVVATWKKVREDSRPEDQDFGTVFYTNLFRDYPFLHHTLFKDTPIGSQRMNLVKWLDGAINLVAKNDMVELMKALDVLGARHVLYGTEDAQYAHITANGLKTLRQMLGNEVFTAETERQWAELYKLVNSRMISASNGPLGAPYRARFIQKRCHEVESLLLRFADPFDAKKFAAKTLATIAGQSGSCTNESAIDKFAACFSSALSDAISFHNMNVVFRAGLDASHDSYIREIMHLSNAGSNSASMESNQTDLHDKLCGSFLTTLELKLGKISAYEKYLLEWYLTHVVNGLINRNQAQYDEANHGTTTATSQPVREDQLASYPLARKSWKRVLDIGSQDSTKKFGSIFYKTLFADHPHLALTIFKSRDIYNQEMNLTNSLSQILSLLDDMPQAVEALRILGARHVLYGVEDEHYPVISNNIIKTVKVVLSLDQLQQHQQQQQQRQNQQWDKATESEWTELVGIIQTTMIDASHSSKASHFRRRLEKSRIDDFTKIVKQFAAPFEPHKLAVRVCSIACGHHIDDGDAFASAITKVFAHALQESSWDETIEPIIAAAAAAGKSDAFDAYLQKHASNFALKAGPNGNARMTAKQKLGQAVLLALTPPAESDYQLTPYDEMIINFFTEHGFLKGLCRVSLEDFDDRIANQGDILLVMNPGRRVIDCTEFVMEHPGGEDVIKEHCGKDATQFFAAAGHSEGAKEQVNSYWCGNLTELDYQTLIGRQNAIK